MLISPARYLVRNIYQDAREIFLVRDFRDVWLSARSINRRRGLASFERSKFPNDLEWLRGLAFSSRQIRLAHTATGPQAQLIKFEDLMRDPHSTLSHMLSQLGVDGSPARVGAMISEANSTETNDAQSHRTSISNQYCGRWRSEMTEEERSVAAEVFGDDLTYFGYEIS
jgi:hypothetical protein